MKSCPKCQAPLDGATRFCPECGTNVESAGSNDPLVGKVIANSFRLVKPLGSGAMGTIYQAEQISLQKVVVIKLLHKHLLGDPTLSKRFHREAKAASLLNHPNCIQVIDFGQDADGMLYIAMEYIDGKDLSELLYEEFPLDWRRVVKIMKQACMALDEAHANGVIHRDLKPENIMVLDRRNQKDFVKVLDFGIAKLQESSPGGAGTFQTVAGVVCGTPEYMSPEQARGEKLDARSDLYSMGIMLYQMLTNRLPFEADSALGVVTKHLAEQPKPPREHNPAVPASLESLCLALIRKKREERPPTCMDVVAELDRVDREIEAGISQNAALESDRTLVEVRPVQLAELEAARAQYQQRMAAQHAQAQLTPQQQAMQATATAHGQPAAGFAPPPAQAQAQGGGSAKMWIITVVVAVVVAVLAFVIFKLASGDAAPATDAAPLTQPLLDGDGASPGDALRL